MFPWASEHCLQQYQVQPLTSEILHAVSYLYVHACAAINYRLLGTGNRLTFYIGFLHLQHQSPHSL